MADRAEGNHNDHAVEILLVEDDPDDLELSLMSLREHRVANRIEVARDGVEALEFLFGNDERAGRIPKVVMLDLKLPKVDGLEVLRKIRSDPATRLLPVVVLTSSNEERDRLEGYELGVNSYVRKPVSFEQFSRCVRDLGLYWLLLNEPPPSLEGA